MNFYGNAMDVTLNVSNYLAIQWNISRIWVLIRYKMLIDFFIRQNLIWGLWISTERFVLNLNKFIISKLLFLVFSIPDLPRIFFLFLLLLTLWWLLFTILTWLDLIKSGSASKPPSWWSSPTSFFSVPYLIFVPGTVKFLVWCQKKCELVCFAVKILNLVFYGVENSVFLVSNITSALCQSSSSPYWVQKSEARQETRTRIKIAFILTSWTCWTY